MNKDKALELLVAVCKETEYAEKEYTVKELFADIPELKKWWKEYQKGGQIIGVCETCGCHFRDLRSGLRNVGRKEQDEWVVAKHLGPAYRSKNDLEETSECEEDAVNKYLSPIPKTEDEVILAVKRALESEKKIDPAKRFKSLVDSGLIDEDGNLIRDEK